MKNERICKVVQDLLPNYIEKLTNEETNKFIEEHLLECDECKKTLENMQRDLKMNDNENKDIGKVKYIKKYNRILKTFEITTFILLIIAIGVLSYYTFFYKDRAYYFRDATVQGAEELVDMFSKKMYPDAFYATIESIEDSELFDYKTVKVKGLDINDVNHRGIFSFDICKNYTEDDFKIEFYDGTTIGIEQLKVGQKIAVYNFIHLNGGIDVTNFGQLHGGKDITEPTELHGVRKLVVLDENL